MRKLIITADLHIFQKFDMEDLKQQLLLIVAACRSADELWILGDIFHTAKPTPQEIGLLVWFINQISIPIQIVYGNHDRILDTEYSLDWLPKLHKNVTLYTTTQIREIEGIKTLFGHFNVKESLLGAYDVALQSSLGVEDLDCVVAFLGHIHSGQLICKGGTYKNGSIFDSWLTGFLEGDGCIRVHQDKERVNIGLDISQKNPKVLEYIKTEFGEGTGYLEKNKNQSWYVYSTSSKIAKKALDTISSFCVSRKRIDQWNNEIKVYNDKLATDKQGANKNKFEINTKLIEHDPSWPWLAGLWEAEGCIGTYLVSSKFPVLQVRITQKEIELLEKIKIWLSTYGISSSISSNGTAFNLGIKSRFAEKFIQYIYPFLVTNKKEYVSLVENKINALLQRNSTEKYLLTTKVAYHPGNLTYLDFGERNDKKSFLAVEFNAGKFFVKTLPVFPIPIYQFDICSDSFNLEALRNVEPISRVKVRISYSDPGINKIELVKQLRKINVKEMKIVFKFVSPGLEELKANSCPNRDNTIEELFSKFVEEFAIGEDVVTLIRKNL